MKALGIALFASLVVAGFGGQVPASAPARLRLTSRLRLRLRLSTAAGFGSVAALGSGDPSGRAGGYPSGRARGLGDARRPGRGHGGPRRLSTHDPAGVRSPRDLLAADRPEARRPHGRHNGQRGPARPDQARGSRRGHPPRLQHHDARPADGTNRAAPCRGRGGRTAAPPDRRRPGGRLRQADPVGARQRSPRPRWVG